MEPPYDRHETKQDWAYLVQEFIDAQGQFTPPHPTGVIPYGVNVLRLRLMLEELAEYSIAVNSGGNDELVADAICDMLYVVIGTAISHGMGPILDELFREVHRSNMTKDFRPIGNGEKGGFKGEKYSPPLLGPILRNKKGAQ